MKVCSGLMSSERSEPVGSLVKVVNVCFAYVVKPFTGEVVKVCLGPYVHCAPIPVSWRRRYIGYTLHLLHL